jgi:hypothetical protein
MEDEMEKCASLATPASLLIGSVRQQAPWPCIPSLSYTSSAFTLGKPVVICTNDTRPVPSAAWRGASETAADASCMDSTGTW